MRSNLLFLAFALACVAGIPLAYASTCDYAYVVEAQPPAAFAGISTGLGFTSRFWAWGANPSDQGSGTATFTDDAGGVALSPGILWANSSSCSGSFTATGVLVEAQTVDTGGRFAVVAVQGVEVELDRAQGGTLQSVAASIPAPGLGGNANGSDGYGAFLDVGLRWSAPSSSAWALSNLGAVHVGYALYVIAAAPVNTGNKGPFTWVTATPSGSQPYITNDSDSDDGYLPLSQTACAVRLRSGQVYYFAVALRLDGSAATGGEPQADASAVETSLVSACSGVASATGVMFADGFETGNTSRWSQTVP